MLQDVIIASKCLAVMVDSPQEAESLLGASLCSPAQVNSTPMLSFKSNPLKCFLDVASIYCCCLDLSDI